MKVGFIGLGIMGKPMSKNLVKAGHELVVFDFNEAAVKELADMGAVAAKSSADVAGQCDAVSYTHLVFWNESATHFRMYHSSNCGVIRGLKKYMGSKSGFFKNLICHFP